MLDVAIRKADGTSVVDWQHVGVRTAPPLPVLEPLRTILPDGLRRGTTVSVMGSVSLLLALLGAASADGAWCALVGFPLVSAEAAAEYGIDLTRLAVVPATDLPAANWTTAVGALLDAVDIVAARPPQGRAVRGALAPADIRRLAARARSKDAVLVPFVASETAWPGADVRLRAGTGTWLGTATGTGRLRARRLDVAAGGKGPAARPRTATLWLPADGGGVGKVEHPPLTSVGPDWTAPLATAG